MLKNTFAALIAVALVSPSAAFAADTGKTGTETPRPTTDAGVKKGLDSGIKKGADAGVKKGLDSGIKKGAEAGKTSSPR
jgi:hypothetical protein